MSRGRIAPAIVFGMLAIASLTVLSRADAALGPSRVLHPARRPLPLAKAGETALGKSGVVRMRTAMPSAKIDLPLELTGTPHDLHYEWIALGTLTAATAPRPLAGHIFAPAGPGFYRLAVVRGDDRRVIEGVMLGVLKPMAEKRGAAINGYRMGFYRGERRGNAEVPSGFLQVTERDAALPVSQHLTLQDFLTHDAQTTWPKYVALDPRLLDKLELVFEEIARWRGQGTAVDVDVHSGFRTPLHNQRVPRAASDSRHQFGDAADIAVDANGDGRVTAADVQLVARAVDVVERRHADLVGGLGVYTRRAPYAHIDVRGRRVRWRG